MKCSLQLCNAPAWTRPGQVEANTPLFHRTWLHPDGGPLIARYPREAQRGRRGDPPAPLDSLLVALLFFGGLSIQRPLLRTITSAGTRASPIEAQTRRVPHKRYGAPAKLARRSAAPASPRSAPADAPLQIGERDLEDHRPPVRTAPLEVDRVEAVEQRTRLLVGEVLVGADGAVARHRRE